MTKELDGIKESCDKITAFLWHMNSGDRRNSRAKIIERIEHDKKINPTSMDGVHDKFLHRRAKSGTGFKKIGKMGQED